MNQYLSTRRTVERSALQLELVRLCGCVAFAGSLVCGTAARADEPLELPPREAEILKVMPRIATAAPAPDPPWVYRGAIRPDGTFEFPLPKASNEVNSRQIELLRALDKLRPFKTADSEPELGSIADKLGPEVLPIPPRIKK
jgi:hypothetical protein